MDNQAKLENGGVIRAGHKFSDGDKRLIESLSNEEVDALINVRIKVAKTGEDFFKRNCTGDKPPVGIVF